MSKVNGFLLFEIGIAIILISILSMTIGIWYFHMVHAQEQSINRFEALVIACSQLEQVRANRKIPDKSLFTSDKFTLKWQIKRNIQLENLALITIFVQWLDGNIRHNVKLTTEAILK